MLQPHEQAWWWKVAMHLDEAQRSMIAVLAINVDDPTPSHLLQGKLREVQAFLLEIFRWKGLLPGVVISGPAASTVVASTVVATAQGMDVAPADEVIPASSVDEVIHASSQTEVTPTFQVDDGVILAQEIVASATIISNQESLSKSASNLASVDALIHREGLDR